MLTRWGRHIWLRVRIQLLSIIPIPSTVSRTGSSVGNVEIRYSEWCEMRCRRMQGAGYALAYKHWHPLKASEINQCAAKSRLRCVLCYGITASSPPAPICGLRYYSRWGAGHDHACRRKLPRRAKDLLQAPLGMAVLSSCLQCHAHAMSCPEGLRDLTAGLHLRAA